MKNTMVMLFHTREACEQFRNELNNRGIGDEVMTVIEADDLPQYGRGEHAVSVDRVVDTFISKLGDLFHENDLDPSHYPTLADFLESKGLDPAEADYYEREVRSGSTMLCVVAGDKYDTVKEVADKGIITRGERGGTGVLNEGVLGRRAMDTQAPVWDKASRPDEVEGHEIISGGSNIVSKPATDPIGDIGRNYDDVDLPLRSEEEPLFDRRDLTTGSPGDFQNQPIGGRPIGHERTIDRDLDRELKDIKLGATGTPPLLRDDDRDIGGASDIGNIGMTPGFDREDVPKANLGETEAVPPGAESRPVRPSDELNDLRHGDWDEDQERPAA